MPIRGGGAIDFIDDSLERDLALADRPGARSARPVRARLQAATAAVRQYVYDLRVGSKALLGARLSPRVARRVGSPSRSASRRCSAG